MRTRIERPEKVLSVVSDLSAKAGYRLVSNDSKKFEVCDKISLLYDVDVNRVRKYYDLCSGRISDIVGMLDNDKKQVELTGKVIAKVNHVMEVKETELNNKWKDFQSFCGKELNKLNNK
jgi:hypothetical protein